MNLHESHFKETTPEETVKNLKNILEQLDIDVEEVWSDVSTIGTYSLRLRIKGTDIGSNGKGISKEYARASAYAEFMERLQNDILVSAYLKKDNSSAKNEEDIGNEPDGKILTSEEIVDQGGAFIDFYFQERGMQNASREEKINRFKSVNKFDYMMTGDDNAFLCLPFYSYKENKVYYLPKHVYQKYYGSNGMAAGNKPAEALVQGYSEILERVAQTRIFTEKSPLPIIPDDYIRQYPYIFEMYEQLRSDKNYKVELLDCSFGGKYPVAALLIKLINTGCYGIKLGCHPDFALAMERTFTEAAQGNDVKEYVNRSILDFNDYNVKDKVNIENSFKTGLAQYPFEVFSKMSSEKFIPCEDVTEKSNGELFKTITQKFLSEGHDVLIRDVSNLGFPSYHIIIPGVSELKPGDDKDFRASDTRAFVTTLLMQPKFITKDNCRYILASFGYYAKSSMNNTLTSFYPEIEGMDLPAENYHCGIPYLSAMCECLDGNFDRAEKYMEFVEKSAINTSQSDYEVKKMRAIKYYFAGRSVVDDHEWVLEYLSQWFDNEFCSMLDYLFSDISKTIVKQYKDCSNWRELSYFRPQRIAFRAVSNLRKMQKENPIDQYELGKLL